jgi:hypothetical protein
LRNVLVSNSRFQVEFEGETNKSLNTKGKDVT